MRKTVFIVDDSLASRQMIKIALCADGYCVAEAGDGREAVEMLEKGLKPDLIIADEMMPGIGYSAFTKGIRNSPEHGRRPVLIMSAGALDEARAASSDAGVTGWITRPFSPGHLLSMVRLYIF